MILISLYVLFDLKVDIPAASVALQSLMGSSSVSLEHVWEVGWSLASSSGGHRPYFDAIQKEVFNKHSSKC